jgi:hypothetical protein
MNSGGFSSLGNYELAASTVAVDPNRGAFSGRQHPQVGNVVPGVFTPVLAKHSNPLSLIDCVSVGVDGMQRNFEPMRKQVERRKANSRM